MLGNIIIGGILGGLAFWDIRKKLIPIFGPIVLAVVGFLFVYCTNQLEWKSMIGGLALGGGLLLVSLISKGKIGLGDGLVLAALGVYLGFLDNLVLLFYGTLCSGVTAFILLLFKKARLTSEIPFVPFLAAAYILVMVT